jgi:hypothetical protein
MRLQGNHFPFDFDIILTKKKTNATYFGRQFIIFPQLSVAPSAFLRLCLPFFIIDRRKRITLMIILLNRLFCNRNFAYNWLMA